MNAELYQMPDGNHSHYPAIVATYTDPQGKATEVQVKFAGLQLGLFHVMDIQTRKRLLVDKHSLSELKVYLITIDQL